MPVARRQEKRSARRNAILNLAREFFFRRGYAGTTMSGLAARLGGSKSTLWTYFRTKETLFQAAVEDAAATLRQDLEASLDTSTGAAQTLRAFADIFVVKLTSPHFVDLHRLVVSEALRFPELGRIFHQHAFQPTHAHLTAYFAGEMEARRMRTADPQQAAFEIMCLLQRPQQFLLWNMEGIMNTQARDIYLRSAVDTFMRAYQILQSDQ